MGPERVLQAARRLTILVGAAAGVAHAAPHVAVPKERVAIIDVGPADGGQARRTIGTAIVAGGLAPLIGDGIDDALAGTDLAPDVARIAAAMTEAQRAFGELDCTAATAASVSAIGVLAARQAAGIAVPELPRAWTYMLLCAERAGNSAMARTAVTRLRVLGGASAAPDVPADMWTKYPEVDTLLDRELYPIEISADVPGAVIWIDHERAGVSPLKTSLPAGDHVIAAAKGERRGFAIGNAVKTQATLEIPTSVQRGTFGALAKRVASWGSNTPAASEIGEVLTAAKVRVAIVRRGDAIEAWGRAGHAGEPHRLGGEDGSGTIADAPRLVALIADRVAIWSDHAPDPDVLLTEQDVPILREKRERADEPTKWWVYASLAGAIVAGGTLLFVMETSDATQRVELHVP